MEYVQIVKGEDKTLIFNLVNQSAGTPYDLSGYTALSACFLNADDTTLTKSGALISSDAGKYSVTLSDTETALLKTGRVAMYLVVDKGTAKNIITVGLERALNVVAKPF